MIAFKVLFIVLDSLLILGGIVLAIISFYAAFRTDKFHLENSNSWSVVLLKVIGAFGLLVAITGIAGLVAAVIDSNTLKQLYNGVLKAIATLLLVLGTIAILTGVLVKTALDNSLRDGMLKYSSSQGTNYQIDILQQQLECCGLTDPPVYKDLQKLPWSCCNQDLNETQDQTKLDLIKDLWRKVTKDGKLACHQKDAYSKKCDEVYSGPCITLKNIGIVFVVLGLVLFALAVFLCLS